MPHGRSFQTYGGDDNLFARIDLNKGDGHLAGPPNPKVVIDVKGIIFNLAEEVVTAAHGEEVWDDILQASGVDGAYTSLGSYPDEELGRLVEGAATRLGADPATVVRTIGEGAIPLLAQRFTHFFAPHDTARSFVLTLNDIIHPEVRKLYPGADVPEFDFDVSDETTLGIVYRSPRRLCALAEGFVRGAATHFGETVVIEHDVCMHHGAAGCELRCRFAKIGSDGGSNV